MNNNRQQHQQMLIMQQQLHFMQLQLEQQRQQQQQPWWMWLAALLSQLQHAVCTWLRSMLAARTAAATATVVGGSSSSSSDGTSAAAAATEPAAAALAIKGAAPFPSVVNAEGSRWASAQGAALREPFWTSEGFVRLMWATNPKRVPPLRNTTELYFAARPASNLLVNTPDGNLYIGWSAPHDGFLYYADRSVRRCYLELAALRYARCCPGALPDPAAPPRAGTDAGTRRRAFIAQTTGAGVASSRENAHIEAQLQNDSATSRILQRHAGGAGVIGAAGAISAGGSTMRAVAMEEAMRGARADRRAVLLRAHADRDRTVLDYHSGIVASGWPPQLRSLWLQRERLGGLSFQLVGKLAAALQPAPRAPCSGPCSGRASSSASSARRGGGGGGVSVKYAFVQPSAGAATAVAATAAATAARAVRGVVDLRASHGMTTKDFTARRAQMLASGDAGAESGVEDADDAQQPQPQQTGRRLVTFASKADPTAVAAAAAVITTDHSEDNYVHEDDYAGFDEEEEEEEDAGSEEADDADDAADDVASEDFVEEEEDDYAGFGEEAEEEDEAAEKEAADAAAADASDGCEEEQDEEVASDGYKDGDIADAAAAAACAARQGE